MAAAPTIPLVSEEEYLRTEYEIPCEFVDGVLLEKHVGRRKHAVLKDALLALLKSADGPYGVRTYSEVHLKVGPGRYRVPDLLVLPADHRRDEILSEPPLVTIEVISAGEPMSELSDKYRDHHAMGVPLVILADPYRKNVFTVGTDGLLRQLAAPLQVEAALPGGTLTIDFDYLFSQVD